MSQTYLNKYRLPKINIFNKKKMFQILEQLKKILFEEFFLS